MSKLEIKITETDNICLNILCLGCESNFSTELDSFQQNSENLLFSTTNILYCTECETAYEYDLIINENYLQIIFQNSNLSGNLEYSSRVDPEEYRAPSSSKSKKFYKSQIESFQKLLNIKSGEYLVEQSLNRLVFTGVITALETYLNEIYILVVFHSESTIEKFVNDYEPYKKERLILSEIFTKYKSLHNRIKEDLDNILYHNISKLVPIFDIYDFELTNFDKIKNIAKHIQKRHNLVHRSGLDENDNFCEVLKIEVAKVIEDTNLFVEYIDNKIKNKCFLDEFERDFPF